MRTLVGPSAVERRGLPAKPRAHEASRRYSVERTTPSLRAALRTGVLPPRPSPALPRHASRKPSPKEHANTRIPTLRVPERSEVL
ncbi:hypothetical protein M885DRAFT_163215 [Pelagophyceae sp. CCMP2097]|nr:hypothetical protein M885DRAFT_163215 [Pelagophyceae sp. CCMP2097]